MSLGVRGGRGLRMKVDGCRFKQFLKHWNIETSDKNVEAIIRASDANGDGHLDYQEFVKKV